MRETCWAPKVRRASQDLCLELDLVGLQVAISVLAMCPVSVVSIGFGDGEP